MLNLEKCIIFATTNVESSEKATHNKDRHSKLMRFYSIVCADGCTSFGNCNKCTPSSSSSSSTFVLFLGSAAAAGAVDDAASRCHRINLQITMLQNQFKPLLWNKMKCKRILGNHTHTQNHQLCDADEFATICKWLPFSWLCYNFVFFFCAIHQHRKTEREKER